MSPVLSGAPDTPEEAALLISFWRTAGSKRWFKPDRSFDDMLRERFGLLHRSALQGKLDTWKVTAEGSLGLVLLLDQISRNLHRGTADAYSGDERALDVAGAAIERGFDGHIALDLRPFLYLPFQHAEDMASQERSVTLTEALSRETGFDDSLRWARHHRDIIARFGRFPHRNAILNRTSTIEEMEFLEGGGFGA